MKKNFDIKHSSIILLILDLDIVRISP